MDMSTTITLQARYRAMSWSQLAEAIQHDGSLAIMAAETLRQLAEERIKRSDVRDHHAFEVKLAAIYCIDALNGEDGFDLNECLDELDRAIHGYSDAASDAWDRYFAKEARDEAEADFRAGR